MTHDGMIERVWLSNLKGAPQRRTIGAHQFQTWLADWWALKTDGWDVTVLISQDGYFSHAVALACRAREAQMSLWGGAA